AARVLWLCSSLPCASQRTESLGHPWPSDGGYRSTITYIRSLELVPRPNRVARTELIRPNGHPILAAILTVVLPSQIDSLQHDLEIVVEVIRDAQIDLTVVFRELRASAAALVGGVQELVTPVVSEARRDAVVLVHQRDVGGIGQADQRKLVLVRILTDISFYVSIHDRVTAGNTKAAIAEEVLRSELPAKDIAFAVVDGLSDAEDHFGIVRVWSNVVEAKKQVDECLAQHATVKTSLELGPCRAHVAAMRID